MTNGQEETMTSVYNRILGLLAILLVIPACMKLEQEPLADQDIIGFNVVEQSLKTKAAFSTSSTFMTRAYKLGAGQTWAADYNSATPEFGPETVSYQSGGYWTTSTKHYWPDAGSLTFFSYSLANMNSAPTPTISISGVSLNDYSVTTNPDGEILVADIAADKTKNESYAGFTGVPTHFKHKLSKVQFKLALSQYAEAGTEVTLTGLELIDIYTVGDYKYGGYAGDFWDGYSGLRAAATDPLNVWSGSQVLGETLENFGKATIVIPQTLTNISASQHAGVRVKYTITVGSSTEDKVVDCYFDDHFKSGVWEMGKIYTYKIHIGVGLYPILFDGSVGDWSSSNGGDVQIGG